MMAEEQNENTEDKSVSQEGGAKGSFQDVFKAKDLESLNQRTMEDSPRFTSINNNEFPKKK